MKANIVTATVVFVLVALVAFPSVALAYEFLYHTDYTVVSFGGWSGASRGSDSHDLAYTSAFGTSEFYALFYKQHGVDGWDADNCFLVRDARPLLQAGQTEIFNDLYIWAGTAATPQTMPFSMYPGASFPGFTYTLRLVQIPVGVSYTGPTQWDQNHGPISLPFYATDNPLTGYRFQAVVTAVPEPSSMLALVAGMGVMGAAFRRRSRES